MFGTEKVSPELLLGLGSGLLSGRTWNEQVANAGTGALTAVNANKEKQARDLQLRSTADFLRDKDPQLAAMVQNGSIQPADAYKQYLTSAQDKAKASQPSFQFKELPDGTYGNWDQNSGKFVPMGKYEKPVDPTSIQRDLQAAGLQPGTPEYQKAILQNYNKAGGEDDYANRQAMADKLGLKQDDPAYRPFILTGKLPREDQQALTAVDKKAILDADEMVAVNQQAIDALKSARNISDQANAGWMSGARATVGANLPDWLVPDAVSSPESSSATIDFDNAVVGQALTQLKAIFGGAPTEGERKILLDLQGSSNLPKEARQKILDRAVAAAERRLQFNMERANDLRGGTYYKPGRDNAQPTTPNEGTTSSGIKFSVEP